MRLPLAKAMKYLLQIASININQNYKLFLTIAWLLHGNFLSFGTNLLQAQCLNNNTVEPRFNKTLYKKILGITNIIKNWSIVLCHFRDLIGLAAIVYELLYHV